MIPASLQFPYKTGQKRRRLKQRTEAFHILVPSQQTFVLMKTPWRRLSSSSSEEVLIRTNIFTLLIRLQKTSSEVVFKTSSRRVAKTFSRHLEDIFKTSSRYLQEVLLRRFQEVFKTSSRQLQDVLQRCLQDLFKTYHRVNLFLLTRFQEVFETFSKRF